MTSGKDTDKSIRWMAVAFLVACVATFLASVLSIVNTAIELRKKLGGAP
jgi:hypothetical protein